MKEFKLWLEFEEVEPGNWDIHNESANIKVDLPEGRQYGINVWTYQFFETAIKTDQENAKNLSGTYQIPPDLFIKEMTRNCIENTIQDLLRTSDLENVLNPSIKIEIPDS
ncbi:MAG: hypothetical protein NXI09_15425 [Bacteroidetes bacterium]|nr:hypothetical protein [Bacteroidota bacterium]